jgi:pimeloyl-ACP methyl ester carboxylesterase
MPASGDITKVGGGSSSWRKRILIALAVLVTIVLGLGVAFRLRPVAFLEARAAWYLRSHGVESLEAVVEGHSIHYLAEGPKDGKPVVLLHGLGDHAEHWGPLSRYLVQAGFRVYAPDLLGFGRSDKPPEASYSISEQARIVLGWLDVLGLKQVDLCGWSMGGWISQRVALDHPERVRRLVLFDSAGLNVPVDWDPRIFTPKTREEFGQFVALLSPQHVEIPGYILDDVLRRRAETNWVTERALAAMLTSKDATLTWKDATDAQLPTLKMPVLILWGSIDHVSPVSEGEAMHRLIPSSEWAVFDGCGHLAPADCATQMGPRVVKFLN